MQETKGSPCASGYGRVVKVLLAAGFLAAGGCAPIPRMDSPPAMKKVDELGSSTVLQLPTRRGRGTDGGACMGTRSSVYSSTRR